jgi:hypothetical protein
MDAFDPPSSFSVRYHAPYLPSLSSLSYFKPSFEPSPRFGSDNLVFRAIRYIPAGIAYARRSGLRSGSDKFWLMCSHRAVTGDQGTSGESNRV